MTESELYLIHYGVKGMKWGVKNGPPYPITDGTRRRELAIDSAVRYQFDNIDHKNRDTYISYTKQDREIYSNWIKSYANKNAYEFIYEFRNTLKIPSKKEQRDVFDELCKDKTFMKALSQMNYCRELVNKNKDTDFSDPDVKKAIRNTNNNVILNKRSFQTFIEWFTLRSISPDIDRGKNMFIDELKKRGYNAITDLNDYGSMAYDPLIVFDIYELINKVSVKKIL